MATLLMLQVSGRLGNKGKLIFEFFSAGSLIFSLHRFDKRN
jgi:hypothetical protein